MKNLKSVFKKIIDKGAIDNGDNIIQKPKVSKITNKILLKELVDHFNDRIEELSVGRRLLYPMSFNILMHPEDYNRTKESLPFVLPEVVAAFYASIKAKCNTYHDGVNFAPPATYWFFQFSACQIGMKGDTEDFIKRGEIVTTASLTTFVIQKAQQSNVRTEANIHLSVKCQNSDTNANNINMDALLGMEILSEGSYTFDFDKTLNEDTSIITSTSGMPSSNGIQRNGLAKLRWAAEDGSGNDKVYEMVDDYIDISGNADRRITRNIVKILSDEVSVSHVQIRYDRESRTFALAAFAKTRLNSREVPLSTTGGAPQWVPLSNNSKIFLNDTVSIKFEINSDLL